MDQADCFSRCSCSAAKVRTNLPGTSFSVCTNFATGGLNPAASRQMAVVNGGWGRIVWMPTWDAEHYVRNHGNDRPFITVARTGPIQREPGKAGAM